MSGTCLRPTQHLDLIPYSPRDLRSLYEGAEAFERGSGYKVAKGLTEFMRSDAVRPEWLARLQSATEPDPWVFGFAILHRESQMVIGSAGFTGPPSEGVVEIAYGIAPEFQGKGYATEAARALIDFAFDSGRVNRVRAHTLPERNPSTSVLTKCGFKNLGEWTDPVDGVIWRWELTKG